MIRPLRYGLAFLALAALPFGGCLQAEQKTTLFPDGSGKLHMKIGLKKSMLAMMEQMAKSGAPEGQDLPSNPLEELTNPLKLQENNEGIVAWAKPVKKETGDWIYVTTTAYFEDINKVKTYSTQTGPGGTQERQLSFSATYKRTDEGHVLEMANEMREGLQDFPPGGQEGAPENPELQKAVLQMMKPMLEGMKVEVAVTVPGTIKKTAGFIGTKGRTAAFKLDAEGMLAIVADPEGEAAKELKKMAESETMKVVWAEHSVTDAEAAAFRKEMAEAKAAWRKLLDEAKKKGGDATPKKKKSAEF